MGIEPIPDDQPLVAFELDENQEGTGESEFYCCEKCWEKGYKDSSFGAQTSPEISVEHSPDQTCRVCQNKLATPTRRGRRLFTYSVPIKVALTWQLHKECLNWALVDRAEEEATKAGLHVGGMPFAEAEAGSKIDVVGDNFVVIFFAFKKAEEAFDPNRPLLGQRKGGP